MITHTVNYKTNKKEEYKTPSKSKKSSYNLAKLSTNKSGSQSERYTIKDKYLDYRKLNFCDIETVLPHEPIDIGINRLDMYYHNYMFQFSMLLQKEELEQAITSIFKALNLEGCYNYSTLPNKKRMKELIYKEGKTKVIKNFNDTEVYITFKEKEEYILLNICSVSVATNTLIKSFIVQNSKYDFAGFNSNKFDGLALNKSGWKVMHDSKKNSLSCILNDKTIKYHKELVKKRLNNPSLKVEYREQYTEFKVGNKKEYRKNYYDLLALSKAFQIGKLANLGGFLDLPKLNSEEELTLESRIEYNNRDVEILYEFVKFLNLELGIYVNNIPTYIRKLMISKMFENTDVEYINCPNSWNEYQLVGARTEQYIRKFKYGYYVDFFSLYPSSRTELKVFSPDPLYYDDKREYTDYERKIHNKKELKKKELNPDYEIKELPKYKKPSLTYSLIVLNNFEKEEFKKNIDYFRGFFASHFNSFDLTYRNLSEEYHKLLENTFYIGKFKIKGVKKLPYLTDEQNKKIENKLKFIFPFNYKGKLHGAYRRLFQFKKNQVYEIMGYEIIFLAFFDYEILEVNKTYANDDILKNTLKEYSDKKKTSDKKGLVKFYKLILNGGFGIFGTKNTDSELINMDKDNELVEYIKKYEDTVYICDDDTEEVLEVVNDKNFRNIKTEDNQHKVRYFDKYLVTNNYETFKVQIIGNKYFKASYFDTKPYTDNSIPAIALSIVSNARFMMYSTLFLNNILEDTTKIRCAYTDTDSGFIDEYTYNKLKELDIIGNDLGYMTNELISKEGVEWKLKRSYFKAPKSYAYFYKNPITGEWKYNIINKGTGASIEKVLVKQSANQSFSTEIRPMHKDNVIQKRVLKNNLYMNEMSTNEYNWKEVYQPTTLIILFMAYLVDTKQYDKLNDEKYLDRYEKKFNELSKKDNLSKYNKSYNLKDFGVKKLNILKYYENLFNKLRAKK